MKFETHTITNWISNIAYPPVRIYAGKPQGKQEKAAIKICEEIYSLTYEPPKKNVLGDMKSSWRELEVSLRMIETMEDPHIKTQYFHKQCDNFLSDAQNAINAMDNVFKKHQDLNQYYKGIRVSYQEIKSVIDKIKHEMLAIRELV